MLRALEVRDFVIIERASLEPGEGFSTLTGETGAGKSLLVDALELLLGGRGDAALVREGAERAELSGEFDASKALEAWLAERDLAGDPGQLVMRRSLDRAGRSRCFINGHVATLSQLREAGEWLVDLHGQHAHQSLLRTAAQRELLDAHAGAEPLARETAQAYRDWKRLEQVAAEASAKFAEREAERADIGERLEDLRKLAPREGEWQEVAAEHKRLQHGSSLLAGAQSSLEALTEAEGAALSQLGAVAAQLKHLSENDAHLAPIVEMLESAEAQANEAVRELRHYASRVELDPEALREAEARIEALHAAARRHRLRPEELPGRMAELERRMHELELAVNPEALEREVAAARARYDAAARKLSAKRATGGQALSKSVTAALAQLAMQSARFNVALGRLEEPSAQGAEAVEFEVASHPSLPLRPLAKEIGRASCRERVVVSGGDG